MKTTIVVSGKGGVGKSTVAASMANTLKDDYSVGFLDADLTGGNAPEILGESKLEVENDVFIPSEHDGVKFVSMSQIASSGDPILWKGRDLRSASTQLLERTKWGDISHLIIDAPPGTGSEPQALMPKSDYALIVTIPSVLAKSNVQRVVNMCRETETPIIGLIKNFTSFKCPNCGENHDIFPEDHSFEGIPTLAEIPINREIAKDKLINEFPIDKILKAMENPVKLEKRRKPMKRTLLKLFGAME